MPPSPPRVTVVGSINMDLVASVEVLPVPGGQAWSAPLVTHPGGKGANQAVAAARAGVSTRMVARVGTDAYGQALTGVLAREGIDITGVVQDTGSPTGIALITVDRQGENTIVLAAGANGGLSLADAAWAAPQAGDVLVAQLETPAEVASGVFAAGRQAGARTVLNAAPAGGCPPYLLDLADVVVVNEHELWSMVAAQPDPARLGDAAARLQAYPGQEVVVTLGGRGVLAVGPKGVTRLAPFQVEVVDTTGAGDCFVGNLAARLAGGAAMADALMYANLAAALCVQRAGAGPSMPRAAEVLQLLGWPR